MRKVYELKKGTKIIYKDEILIFEEIRGENAIFVNQYQEEFIFPDYLDIEEIGEVINYYNDKENKTPTLF